MTLIEAFGLGAVQGVTEFLPISSDGHLALAHFLVDTAESTAEGDLVFDVVSHLGTMLAIVILLRGRIFDLVKAAFAWFGGGEPGPGVRIDQRWVLLLVAASVPTAIVGLALEGPTKWMREQPLWLGIWFCATAALVFAAEYVGARKRGADALGWVDAVLMGIAQGLAVLPGLSRSGTTVATGLWRDLDPKVVVDFSLLMSVPAVLGANLLELLKASAIPPLAPLFVGFASALVMGLAAVKILQWIVVSRRLLPFAIYTALLGMGTLAYGIWHG